MKIKLNKKNLKTLSTSASLDKQATPLIAGAYVRKTYDLVCGPTNRHDCNTGAESCYGRDCLFTNRYHLCD